MIGTFINAVAILVGSTLGIVFHSRLPQRFVSIVFQGIGLFTLFLGFSMALKVHNVMVMIFSIVVGSLMGELIDLQQCIEKFSENIKNRLKMGDAKFSEGLVTAFLLYCMGSMTVLGAIQEGTGEYPKLLLAKSVLDGFASVALSSAFGIGVAFSIVPLLIYQGGITFLAHFAGKQFSQLIIEEMSAVGGILLIGLGITILDIKTLRMLNMLPSLLVAVVLAYFFG